eukprot:Blabericola_migrator_1__7892@NODE_4038_length_1365_cov_3_446841_g2489_i0_p1_GENE_NODE_4038_length_1365_cov_3_446841_g2489_i0NODE_4038_length_1365_cov_3_446841_g2489_i0_p1_ORF_typecomplete_len133_score9_25Viral_cys_rich/PF08008_12/0_11_NODE_4038_length_1365_cov_3_446841_g2489_i09661364
MDEVDEENDLFDVPEPSAQQNRFSRVCLWAIFEDSCTEFREACCRLRQYQTYINVRECQFGHQRFIYLGFMVEDGDTRPDPKEAAKLEAITSPCNAPSLRRFLGCIEYYRSFIPKFATLALPLTLLLRKNRE